MQHRPNNQTIRHVNHLWPKTWVIVIIIFSNCGHYIFYNRVVMSAVKDRKSYHMITCILAMLACCGFSVQVAMILEQPISQHEAVSTIFISVLIGFHYIRASESLILRITCCTYGVSYGGNTILVCRLMNQMHISGMHFTYYIVDIT